MKQKRGMHRLPHQCSEWDEGTVCSNCWLITFLCIPGLNVYLWLTQGQLVFSMHSPEHDNLRLKNDPAIGS